MGQKLPIELPSESMAYFSEEVNLTYPHIYSGAEYSPAGEECEKTRCVQVSQSVNSNNNLATKL